MMKMTTMMIIMSLLLLLLMMMNKKMMMKKKKKNNNSSYECGFNNINKKRSPISIQFYMISVIFLIFDLEMMMIIPIMMTMKNYNMKSNKIIMSFMMMMMMMTIMMEWLNNSIKWKM